MNPNAAELLRLATGIDLSIEEVGNRFVVKGHVRPGTDLPDKLDVLDEQQVVACRDAESADFRVTIITQIQQPRPCERAEAERRSDLR